MKLSVAAKKMIFVICIALLVIVAISAIYYRSLNFLPFAAGALLGSSLNVLKIILIERTFDKAPGMDVKVIKNYTGLQYFFRFILTGAVLMFAALNEYVSLWGAVAGVCTLQVAALAMKFLYKNDS